MAEQQQWFAGKPEEDYGLALASTPRRMAVVAKARELTKRAVDSAIRADSKENGAIMAGDRCPVGSRLWQSRGSAAVGNRSFEAGSRESRRRGRSRAGLCHGGRYGTSRIFGPRLRANAFRWTRRCSRFGCLRFRPNWRLSRKNPAAALKALQAASSPLELGKLRSSPISPACIRRTCAVTHIGGWAGTAAAAEFQKILDHSGIVWNCWTGALAQSGVARANACEREPRRERTPSGPRPGARSLQRFPHPLERRRPGHPDPERSQSRVREAAVVGKRVPHSSPSFGLEWGFSFVLELILWHSTAHEPDLSAHSPQLTTHLSRAPIGTSSRNPVGCGCPIQAHPLGLSGDFRSYWN